MIVAKDIVYITFALMGFTLAFVAFTQVCWLAFLYLFKAFDDYLHR